MLTKKKHLKKLKPGDVIYDNDGDWMVKGLDGEMHQLSTADEPSPVHLPAFLIKPPVMKDYKNESKI